MDAVEFIREWQRMCNAYNVACTGCPMDGEPCGVYRGADAERLVGAVEAWSAAHPRKTRQSVFLEQWPNVKMSKIEPVISILPYSIDQTVRVEYPCSKDCDDCSREFWMQEVE